MAHGLNSSVVKRAEGKGGAGSRRIFAPHFKLQVLDSYRNDADCKGNQRATARKYGIHRRQIQKWLQVEGNLRSSVGKEPRLRDAEEAAPARAPSPPAPMDLSLKSRSAADSDVWDLSTKRRSPSPPPPPPPPPKLFKPYLLDDDAPKRPAAPCCSFAACDYYYNNNNGDTYTLHELQPKGAAPGYYYAAFPYPPPDYAAYDGAALKQRHSYSLDFKLSAIECYYQDEVCKGNQRAVATKYNVHRRQVQKWLKQADELRQKNEVVKQTQTVR